MIALSFSVDLDFFFRDCIAGVASASPTRTLALFRAMQIIGLLFSVWVRNQAVV